MQRVFDEAGATGTQRLLGCVSEPVSGPRSGGGVATEGTVASGTRGLKEHPASIATTIATPSRHRSPCFMGLILLEAFGAGAVLILIVWWTMFSGRKRGEIDDTSVHKNGDAADADDERPPT